MRGWFQSAPAITGGRFSQSPALPPTPSSFNPRPPLLAGVSHHVRQLVAHRLVSIRARHYWRAFHVPWLTWLLAHLFQSAPAITGGRFDQRAATCSGFHLFQSAPAITGGRFFNALAQPYFIRGFNPRPPLLAGVSPSVVPYGDDLEVSIRARHYWRAFRQTGQRCAARCGFNPRPPLLAGVSAHPLKARAVDVVSIRARHYWRAFPFTSKLLFSKGFSPVSLEPCHMQ